MSERVEKLKAKLSESHSDENGDQQDELYRLLDEITFKATRSANNQLFSGLAPFLYGQQEENREILETLDDIKTLIKAVINNG
jgi:hypothetical protein